MARSQELFRLAKEVIPGGVNSPVRAFNGVGGDPIFIKSAHGPYVVDEDNKLYIDYVGSWGPMITGHCHPVIVAAVEQALENGLSFGAPTLLEIQLAEKIKKIMPSLELIRMVNSGTEATMSAIRLARGFTKRDKIIKFAGCYHGHSDSLLVAAGSGALTLGVPSSAGVPVSIAEQTLVAEFNQIETVEKLFKRHGKDIACVIIEPIAGNMNCIPASREFLVALRALCDKQETVLIFDEVMTGFRVARGGAEEHYQIKPDLTTLGKIIGGGMPVGALGGREDIMQSIAPLGPVYQAGTLSGNPIAMSAGIATLDLLAEPDFYIQLDRLTQQLMRGLEDRASAAGVPFLTNSVCGMFGLFFTDQMEVTSFDQVKKCNLPQFKKFFHEMLKQGVYLAPSAYEAGFVSSMHTDEVINKTLEVAERAFSAKSFL